MRLNLLIALCVGLLTYGLTIYLDHNARAPIQTTNTKDLPAGQRQHTPAFTFTDMNVNTHNIRDFEGKSIILNFWATWCPPCIEEFPRFLDIVKEHEGEVILIALSSDTSKAPIERFIKKLGINTMENIYIALDKKSAVKKDIFQSYKLPETYIIGPDQRIKDKLIGAQWSKDELEEILSRE